MKYLVFIFMLVLTSCGGDQQNASTTETGTPATAKATPSETTLSTATTIPTTTPTSVPMDESFRLLLENWRVTNENALSWAQEFEPTITIEDVAGGQRVSIETMIDGIVSTVEIMRVEGDIVRFTDVNGLEVSTSVDNIYFENVGGYNKLYVRGEGTDEDPGHMWRYPWGGFVENRDITFTQNGVSIVANPAEMYGGLFTVNPEQIESTWETTVRGMYLVQEMIGNPAVTSRYPTVESFLTAARAGEEIDGLYMLIPFSERNLTITYVGEWTELGTVKLDSISFDLPHLSGVVISREAASSLLDNEWFRFRGVGGHMRMNNDEGMLKVSLRSVRFSKFVGDGFENLPLRSNGSLEDNYVAVTHLMKDFLLGFEESYSAWRRNNNLVVNRTVSPPFFVYYSPENEDPRIRDTGDSPVILVP